jgi:hypothetical protein
MNSLRLWIGVAAIPAVAAFTIAVDEQQRTLNRSGTFARAANDGDPSATQAAADTETEIGNVPEPELSRWRAVGVRVAKIECSVPPQPRLVPPFHADVIVATRNSKGATATSVLLEDVLVLAGPDATADSQARICTLRLMPEDLLKVRLAGETGIISLAVRSQPKPKR